MSNIDQEADPSESYAAPPRTFSGHDLKPYSLGNKMLLAMITRDGDPDSFFLFAVLYVLTQPRAEVQRDAADKEALREKILSWMDGLSLEPSQGEPFLDLERTQRNPDYVPGGQEKAEALAIQILTEANKEKVAPIPSGAAGNG